MRGGLLDPDKHTFSTNPVNQPFLLSAGEHWAWSAEKPFCTHRIWDALAFMLLG